MHYFFDRQDAGEQLAPLLSAYKKDKNAIVIGLPRGGVETAYAVALALQLPLDIICPRKIGAPMNPEYAIGAITESGQGFFDTRAIDMLGTTKQYIDEAVKKEIQKIQTRLALYRTGMPARNLHSKTVILVDDGLATGATMLAAIKTAKAEQAKKIVVAIPVSPRDTYLRIKNEVDEVQCLSVPDDFYAVGQYYRSFNQTSDEEVIALMKKANAR